VVSLRIYVTGMSGLVGRALVPLLMEESHEVAGRDRVDVCDAVAIERAILAARPRWVVHLAAYTAVDKAEADAASATRVNAGGTENVARAARAAGARFLYMSTDYVYSGEKSGPYREDDVPGPLSAYGRSKLAGEKAAVEVLPEALIVRGGWLYGPGKGFVDTILAAAATSPTLQVVTDETGNPTRAADLARGLAALITAGAEGIVHLANVGGTSRFDLARTALRLAGGDPARILPTTQALYARPARRPRYSVLDCGRFTKLTGSAPRPWEAALAEHVASWRTGAASGGAVAGASEVGR
jgi:dTDP-4-dehydrorhamnose reductase/4-ketoreductase